MTDRTTSPRRFADAAEAGREVERWSAGAQVLALFTTLYRQGWTRYLATPRDFATISEFSGLPPARLRDVLEVLETHGIVKQDGSMVRLSEPFEALAAEDAWIGMDDVLDRAELATRLALEAVRGWSTVPLAPSDALIMARAAGGQTTTVTKAMFAKLMADLPEWPAAMRNGRWLDVGCGVGATTLTLAAMYPQMRAVAIEVFPAIATEAKRRAKELGVSERVDVRNMDARDFAELGAFEGAFWAQPFFPPSSRAGTLAVIRRALRPGGLLIMQELDPEPQTYKLSDDERRSSALRRLLYRGWHMPFGLTAERLEAEAEAAGFAAVRVATTEFGRFVLVRRPAD